MLAGSISGYTQGLLDGIKFKRKLISWRKLGQGKRHLPRRDASWWRTKIWNVRGGSSRPRYAFTPFPTPTCNLPRFPTLDRNTQSRGLDVKSLRVMGGYGTPFGAFSLALGQEDAFAPIFSCLGDEPDKTGDPGQHRTVHHSAAIADSAIATSTKVSEKVGARPRSAKADGLRAFTVAPVRLRLCQ